MRKRLLIIVGIGLGLIILTIAIVLVVDRSPALQEAILPNSNQAQTNTITPLNSNVVTNTTPDPNRAAVTYVARNFAETYGSGTNQNNLANYQQAKQWGTTDFNRFLDRLIAQEQNAPTTPYRGTVSTALVVNISRQTATIASVTVSLQRIETLDTTSRTYNQDLHLDLIKQGADWKINAAAWQAL